MALPAGRYGVTKNQLLKIKKLPMNTIKLIEELTEKYDLLGTAAFKNSTSVVTDSSDLVESGAVKDIVGWGNKNLLPTMYSDGNSKSQNGVVFTKNVDGSVAISIAQSATGNAYYYIYLTLEDFIERGEKYIVNSFLDNNSITLSCNDKVDNAWGNTANSNGSDVEWTPRAGATAYGIWILVASGTTAGTYIVKPMISKDGGAYEPYHASVSDSLAEKCDNSVIGTVEGANASKAWSVGEHFINGGQFKEVTQPIASGGAISDSNTVNKPIADCLVKEATFSGTTNTTGDLKLSTDNIAIFGVKLSTMVSRLATVYYISSGSNAGAWVHVAERDGTDSANTSISGTYYYI